MGVSLSDAAQNTRIRSQYLEALEQGELGLLPSPVQVRGFLRAYASYLGLDAEETLGMLDPGARRAKEQGGDVEQAAEESAIAGKEVGRPAANGFAQIGAELRETREALDLSYREVEERILISERSLLRLESGDFDSFPSLAQARGMLSNYANFLGLESEALLLRYAEVIQARFQAQKEREGEPGAKRVAKERRQIPLWLREVVSVDILIAALLTLGLGTLLIWGIGRISATSAEQGSEATAPPLAEVLLPSPTASLESGPALAEGESLNGAADEGTPEGLPPLTVQVVNPGNVNLQIFPNQRVWARVSADGEVVFEGRMAPGESYSYSATREMRIYTGNAAALRVFLNGQDLGALGIEGEVVDVLFGPAGQATPTPSLTPTPQPTVPTSTATPSATSPASPTIDGEEGGP